MISLSPTSPQQQIGDTRTVASRVAAQPIEDRLFRWVTWGALVGYLTALVALVLVQVLYAPFGKLVEIASRPEVIASVWLTLVSATLATIVAIAISVLVGFATSQSTFRGRQLVESILDIPHIMPPMVMGLSLLLLFQTPILKPISGEVVYQPAAVVVAQLFVACSYSVPMIRGTFNQLDHRPAQLALTLGCTRASAFFLVTIPDSLPGLVAAGAVAWARCVGCFGPLLVFAGATRNKTEVLSTTIFLELQVGDLEGAVAASVLLLTLAAVVLSLTRLIAPGSSTGRARHNDAA